MYNNKQQKFCEGTIDAIANLNSKIKLIKFVFEEDKMKEWLINR